MSQVKLTNNTAKVLRDQKVKTRSGIYRAGQAVLQGGGKRTPRKTGKLRQMTQVKEIGATTAQVLWARGYAAVQNTGKRAGARPFRKYTTPGTGPGFVEVGVAYAKKRVKEFMR